MEDEALGIALVEELLRDFSGGSPPHTSSPSRLNHPASSSGATTVHPSFLGGPAIQAFPAAAEEDLEWLSNEDAFPGLDTFLSDSYKPSPAGKGKRPSPVSVLDGGPLAAPGLHWASGRVRSHGRRRRRRMRGVLYGEGATPPRRGERRQCWHCAAEQTPQWRAGPDGPKTLCNACGVRYKSGRLVPEYRPANSPTFSSELHSNSHRKIMEMRRRIVVAGQKAHPFC